MLRDDTEYILEFRTDIPLENHNLRLVDVHSARECLGAYRIKTPDHCLIVHHHAVTISDQWIDTDNITHENTKEWGPGELLFIPAGSELTAESRHRYDASVIRIKKRWLSHFIRRMPSTIRPVDIKYRTILDPLAFDLALSVYKMAAAPKECHFAMILEEKLAMALTASVVSNIAKHESGSDPELVTPSLRGRRTLDYIEANLHRNITLRDIAKEAALSPSHFSRLFSKRMGMSPMRYLTMQRVSASKAMLLGSNRPLTEIAMECGFSSASHFATAFKQLTGQTPSEYRNSRS